MNNWILPESLNVGGSDFTIRTDFRAILDILNYLEDPDYEEDEKMEICKRILYPDWRQIPLEQTEEALQQAMWFIGGGSDVDDGRRQSVKLMDWEQDANMIIPAINKVAGVEIRAVSYMHWWTFLGYYMEIGESLYTTVLNIRSKRAKRKKLDKLEEVFYRENKSIVDIKHKYSKAEKEEKDRINELFS